MKLTISTSSLRFAEPAPSSTGAPAPDIAPATQIVPTVGLDGKPISAGANTSNDGPAEFPAAAIAIISIVCGLIALFVAYRLYVWSYGWFRHQRDEEDALPETRALAGGGISPGGFATLPSQASFAPPIGAGSMAGRKSPSGFGSYGRTREHSWGGESWGGINEKGDLSPSSPYATTPTGAGSDISRGGSPNSDGRSQLSPSPFPQSSTRGSLAPSYPRRSYAHGSQPLLIHSRTASSFSSGQIMPSGNRISGAPHNPHSRIEVVPPAPLAPPPGTIVQTDKATLDFAPSAGIGRREDENTAEEWLNLASPTNEQQETLVNPHHYDPNYYGLQSSPRQHAFPPSSSGPSSSGSSSSQQQHQNRMRGRPSLPHLRPSPSSGVPSLNSPRDQSASTSGSGSGSGGRPSANSSESSLSFGASRAGPPPPPLKIVTPGHSATNSINVSDESQGERSPLDKLQRRMEREARGLSMLGAPEGSERIKDRQ